LLKVKKERLVPSTGFFHRLLFGAEDPYLYKPINSFTENGDSVYVEKYIDEDLQEREAFAKIVYRRTLLFQKHFGWALINLGATSSAVYW
jgi:hypothetical protein